MDLRPDVTHAGDASVRTEDLYSRD